MAVQHCIIAVPSLYHLYTKSMVLTGCPHCTHAVHIGWVSILLCREASVSYGRKILFANAIKQYRVSLRNKTRIT